MTAKSEFSPLLRSPEVATPALPTKAEPKKRLPPPKVRAAIEAIVSGRARTVRQAAEEFGHISREYLSRSLSTPAGAQYLREKSARAVAMGAGRAAARLNELIESDSQKVALEATKYSLGVAGIRPAPDNVSVNVGLAISGYVIDLSEPSQPAVKIIGGVAQPTERSGPVIDAKPVE